MHYVTCELKHQNARERGFEFSSCMWVSYVFVLYINIHVTSLCCSCPLFPVCHISSKQLLIKCYLKGYNPPPDFTSQTTPVQLTYIVFRVLASYKHDGSVQSTI